MAPTVFIHYNTDPENKLCFQLISVRRVFEQWEIFLYIIRYEQDASNDKSIWTMGNISVCAQH